MYLTAAASRFLRLTTNLMAHKAICYHRKSLLLKLKTRQKQKHCKRFLIGSWIKTTKKCFVESAKLVLHSPDEIPLIKSFSFLSFVWISARKILLTINLQNLGLLLMTDVVNMQGISTYHLKKCLFRSNASSKRLKIVSCSGEIRTTHSRFALLMT